jgi:hypothetical protein
VPSANTILLYPSFVICIIWYQFTSLTFLLSGGSIVTIMLVGNCLKTNILVFLRWIFVIVFHFLIFPLCAFYFQGNLNSIPKGLSVKLLLLS